MQAVILETFTTMDGMFHMRPLHLVIRKDNIRLREPTLWIRLRRLPKDKSKKWMAKQRPSMVLMLTSTSDQSRFPKK